MLSEWFVFVVVKGEHCVRVVWFGVVFGVKEEDFEAVRISGFEGGLHIGVLLPSLYFVVLCGTNAGTICSVSE